MHDLRDYVNGNISNVFEEAGKRGRPRKNPAPEESEYDKIDGKSAESNGSGGAYAVNPPSDPEVDDFKEENDEELYSANKEAVINELDEESDFFIQGRAGWGKSSIILDAAKKKGYEVIVFYLDKCDPVDLAGRIYVDEKGNEKNTVPAFIQKVAANKKQKFLLFFDEMNQAAPDVMNAIMPIINEHVIAGVKYNNLIVGAAGNLMDENVGGVSELSKPLAARLAKIKWETHTKNEWHNALAHLARKYKFSKDFFDYVESMEDWLDSPRDVEKFMLRPIKKRIEAGTGNRTVKSWLTKLEENVLQAELYKKYKAGEKISEKVYDIQKDLDGKQGQADFEKLANMCHDLVEYEGSLKPSRKSRKVGAGKQVPKNVQDLMEDGIKKGYIQLKREDGTDDYTKYAISAENIVEVFVDDGSEFNAETIQKVVDHLTQKVNFKYNTNAEWKKEAAKLKLVDPLSPEVK